MSQLIDKLEDINIHIFLEKHQITNDQGEILDFHNHPFLWDFYTDFSPLLALEKAAQLGLSTALNIKVMYAAKNKGMDWIYSLPSAHDVKDFVGGKTNRLIDNNPIFQDWTHDKDSIEQKKIGDNIVYFRGTWGERQALSTPADGYVSDETDRSKQDIVAQFGTRLQHSKFGYKWYVSNPSVPGIGVDKYFLQSDQKYWFIKCKCGYEWYLTMENIMYNSEGTPYFGCVKCHRELNRLTGRWISKLHDKNISGYKMSLLMANWVSASDILKKKEDMSSQQFSNFVLGDPFVSKGNKLTYLSFFQNINSSVNPQDTRPVIGVDTGLGINVVVGNSHGLFHNDKRNDYSVVRDLLVRWPNAIAIIDQGGDIIEPRKIREEFPGRVWLCFFRQDMKNDELITWNDKDKTVRVDRNRIIQLTIDEFIEKRIPLYGTKEDWWDVWQEWEGMYRTEEENAFGVPVFKWNKPASGRCDFPFSIVYWRVGMDRFMNKGNVTFNEPSGVSGMFETGLETRADGTAFMPKI